MALSIFLSLIAYVPAKIEHNNTKKNTSNQNKHTKKLAQNTHQRTNKTSNLVLRHSTGVILLSDAHSADPGDTFTVYNIVKKNIPRHTAQIADPAEW